MRPFTLPQAAQLAGGCPQANAKVAGDSLASIGERTCLSPGYTIRDVQLSRTIRRSSAGDDAAPTARRGKPLWRSLLEILIAFGIVALAYNFFFASVGIEGEGMSPTLRPGQRVLVSRLPYQLTAPRRGDVVAVRSRIDPARLELHRVIGLPGDTITVRGAQVAVGGLPLQEPYVLQFQERLSLGATTVGQYRIGQDSYFLLNDNRADLGDSRAYGPFVRDQIIGRVWLIYWPPQSIAAVAHSPPVRGQR